MKIFGLNILTDGQMDNYDWERIRAQRTSEFIKQVEDSYRDRWERDQETIKSLKVEIQSRHESQMAIQKIFQDVTKENERITKQLVEAVEYTQFAKSLKKIIRNAVFPGEKGE